MNAAAVLASGRRPFAVGKLRVLKITTFTPPERLLMETGQQRGMTLTGVLQPYGGCLEAKGGRAGVPRGATWRAGKLMETVQIDLA